MPVTSTHTRTHAHTHTHIYIYIYIYTNTYAYTARLLARFRSPVAPALDPKASDGAAPELTKGPDLFE